jgi:WD40 repeat protein
MLASGSEDATVRLWDVASGEQRAVLRGHTAYVENLTFYPDGLRLVSSAANQELHLWDVKSGASLGSPTSPSWRQITRWPRHPGGPVADLALSDDGALVARGGDDGVLRLWDVTTGRELGAFDWGLGPVYAAAFAPDGMTIAVGGRDFRVVIWDVDLS